MVTVLIATVRVSITCSSMFFCSLRRPAGGRRIPERLRQAYDARLPRSRPTWTNIPQCHLWEADDSFYLINSWY